MTKKPANPRDNSVAPIICDNGGWTDTWFAGAGIFNIGVSLCRVQIKVFRSGAPAPDHALRRELRRYLPHHRHTTDWDRHPLLSGYRLHACRTVCATYHGLFRCAGCSTGTSASMTVALISARPADARHRGPVAYARTASNRSSHRAGFADQLCAYGASTSSRCSPTRTPPSADQVSNSVWWELGGGWSCSWAKRTSRRPSTSR